MARKKKEEVETPVVEAPSQNEDNVTRHDAFYEDGGTNHNVSQPLPSLDDEE